MTPKEAFEIITTFSVDSNGKIHIEDMPTYLKACDIVERVINLFQKQKLKIQDLTREELFEIYNRNKHCTHTVKQTCQDFNITPQTYNKVISKMSHFIKYTLDNGKAPYDL